MSGAVLALDTATAVASVAVGVPGRPAVTLAEVGARRHAAEIIPMIDRALRDAGRGPGDLARIIVADGPGSFTGLRIGWAAAKGLAHERGLALLAAPSLLGLAFSAWRSADLGPGAVVAPCYDALRGDVFAAAYAFDPPRVETLVAPALLTLAALARLSPRRPELIVGDGARRYADELYDWCGRRPADQDGAGSALALLELEGWDGGLRPVVDPALAEPVYGRLAEAQVKWEARYGRALPDPSRDAR